MKSITLFLLVILNVFSTTVIAGDGVGNGGDYIAQDFITSAQDAIKYLAQHSEEFPFIKLADLKKSVDSVTIEILPKETNFPNAIRTAENFPTSNKIVINGDRWLQINEPIRKMALALHEILGLTGYEVNNYIITSQLFGISRGEIESPPTINELDHSFDGLRSSYFKLLAQAEQIIPTKVYGNGKILSKEECLAFTEAEIVRPNGLDFDFYCDSLFPDVATTYLITQKGKTNLGVNYSKVFRVVRKDRATREYFINTQGVVVEISEYGISGAGLISIGIAQLDMKGNAFHYARVSDARGVTWEDYASVVLADGSLGTSISKLNNCYTASNGGCNTTINFSAANFNDWRGFETSLFNLAGNNHCKSSPCTWETTGGTQEGNFGGIVFTYKYLNQNFSKPDNYREITYRLDYEGKVYQRSGVYVANRREYEMISYDF